MFRAHFSFHLILASPKPPALSGLLLPGVSEPTFQTVGGTRNKSALATTPQESNAKASKPQNPQKGLGPLIPKP